MFNNWIQNVPLNDINENRNFQNRLSKIHKRELITDNYATSAAELELTKTRFGKMFSIVFCSATVLKSLIVLTKTDETFVRKTVCVCLFVFLLRHYYYILLNADLIFFFLCDLLRKDPLICFNARKKCVKFSFEFWNVFE